MFGATSGTRTRNINLGKVVLYQLSYGRLERPTGLEPVTFGLEDRCSTN